jgi:predicted dehydrogenase
VRDVACSGAIGRPLVAHNQKSYRWGSSRPESFRDRRTFPGIAPWIGIHVFDWLLWILGDRFEEVSGVESMAVRPDYAACASHAAYLLRLSGDGTSTVTMDYLRPEAAPTHGDERIRIAGTAGVVDISTGAGIGTLTDADGVRPLAVPAAAQWYAGFLCAATGQVESHEAPHVLPQWEVFRATEVALKAQQAVDSSPPVDLRQSAFGPPELQSAGGASAANLG